MTRWTFRDPELDGDRQERDQRQRRRADCGRRATTGSRGAAPSSATLNDSARDEPRERREDLGERRRILVAERRVAGPRWGRTWARRRRSASPARQYACSSLASVHAVVATTSEQDAPTAASTTSSGRGAVAATPIGERPAIRRATGALTGRLSRGGRRRRRPCRSRRSTPTGSSRTPDGATDERHHPDPRPDAAASRPATGARAVGAPAWPRNTASIGKRMKNMWIPLCRAATARGPARQRAAAHQAHEPGPQRAGGLESSASDGAAGHRSARPMAPARCLPLTRRSWSGPLRPPGSA